MSSLRQLFHLMTGLWFNHRTPPPPLLKLKTNYINTTLFPLTTAWQTLASYYDSLLYVFNRNAPSHPGLSFVTSTWWRSQRTSWPPMQNRLSFSAHYSSVFSNTTSHSGYSKYQHKHSTNCQGVKASFITRNQSFFCRHSISLIFPQYKHYFPGAPPNDSQLTSLSQGLRIGE